MIYVVCFGLSALLAYLAFRAEKTPGKRWQFFLLSALSILPPVLLAGLRDYSIGIDTSNYYDMARYWGTASTADSLWDYMAFYLPKGYGEVFFALLVGITGQIGSFTLLLFLIHAWIMIWVYVGAYRLRKYVQPWLVLVLFYLAFFSHSLNIMRQYMAFSFLFAFLADLPQKKYLRYTIAVVIATMFHTSGLLSIGLLIVHWLLNGNFTKLKRDFAPSLRKRKWFVFIAVALMVLLFNPLVRVAVSTGLLHKKYLYYVKSPFTGYNLLVILFLSVELIALRLLHKNFNREDRATEFFFTVSGVYFILYQITAFVIYGKRIAACCALANLVTLAMLPKGLGQTISFTLPRGLGGKTVTLFRFPQSFTEKRREILGTGLVIVFVLAYWAYVYVLRNSSGTIPYRFVFQS